MMTLRGAPLLLRMIQRVTAVTIEAELVVATTTRKEDDAIQDLCKQSNVKCFRGHPTDLLDRHYQVGLKERADVVIKIPSDCPLIDPKIIDKVVGFYEANAEKYDFVSNLHPPSYPDGNDVEVVPFHVLDLAWHEAKRPLEREHTTPYIWEQPDRFRIGNVVWETGKDLSMTHRWTIDYPEDFILIKGIYDRLWTPDNPAFSMWEILHLLQNEPLLALVNAKYAGVNWYRHHLHELKTISPAQTRAATFN